MFATPRQAGTLHRFRLMYVDRPEPPVLHELPLIGTVFALCPAKILEDHYTKLKFRERIVSETTKKMQCSSSKLLIVHKTVYIKQRSSRPTINLRDNC